MNATATVAQLADNGQVPVKMTAVYTCNDGWSHRKGSLEVEIRNWKQLSPCKIQLTCLESLAWNDSVECIKGNNNASVVQEVAQVAVCNQPDTLTGANVTHFNESLYINDIGKHEVGSCITLECKEGYAKVETSANTTSCCAHDGWEPPIQLECAKGQN